MSPAPTAADPDFAVPVRPTLLVASPRPRGGAANWWSRWWLPVVGTVLLSLVPLGTDLTLRALVG